MNSYAKKNMIQIPSVSKPYPKGKRFGCFCNSQSPSELKRLFHQQTEMPMNATILEQNPWSSFWHIQKLSTPRVPGVPIEGAATWLKLRKSKYTVYTETVCEKFQQVNLKNTQKDVLNRNRQIWMRKSPPKKQLRLILRIVRICRGFCSTFLPTKISVAVFSVVQLQAEEQNESCEWCHYGPCHDQYQPVAARKCPWPFEASWDSRILWVSDLVHPFHDPTFYFYMMDYIHLLEIVFARCIYLCNFIFLILMH